MNISLILAHPDPKSFNHALARICKQALAAKGMRIYYHDLYRERFNPLLPAEELPGDAVLPDSLKIYCEELASSDGILIIHPNWWGMPPAILKGWIDRALRPGVAYRFNEGDSGEGIPEGLLKAKAAVVFNTSNTPAGREQAVFGDPLENLWKNCIFNLCGVKIFVRKMFGVMITSTPEQRQAWLDEAKCLVDQIF